MTLVKSWQLTRSDVFLRSHIRFPMISGISGRKSASVGNDDEQINLLRR
jgi:hypothetical protein